MLPFAILAQAGAGLIEEVVRDRRPLRTLFQTVGDWIHRANEYLQKEEAGPLTEFCEDLTIYSFRYSYYYFLDIWIYLF